MAVSAGRRFTYAEYLEQELPSLEKHEFFDGQIIAMAGGTPPHSRLKTNLTLAVGGRLRGSPCAPYDADLRIRVLETGLATYPDLSVVCGPIVTDPEDDNAVTNPTALFEVLSKWTAAYDRGQKFDHYRRIPTLRHYVLVDHTRRHVDVYTLRDGEWVYRSHDAGEVVELPAIGVTFDVAELYEGWEPPPEV